MAAFRGLGFSIEPGEIRLDGLVLERERDYIICWKESKSENSQQKTKFHLFCDLFVFFWFI